MCVLSACCAACLHNDRVQVSSLEASLREAKWEAQKQDEAVRRLRTLLGDARGLLANAGIPFMEEDPGGWGLELVPRLPTACWIQLAGWRLPWGAH